MKPCDFGVFNSYGTYQDFKAINRKLYEWREQEELLENDIFSDNSPHELFVNGYCEICNNETQFRIGSEYPCIIEGRKLPNLREHCSCIKCGFNSRMRGVIRIVDEYYHAGDDVYIMEQVTPLYKYFKEKMGEKLIGSEF